MVTGLAGGAEDVAEQTPVRSESRGSRDTTIDHEFGGETCHATSVPTSTAHHVDESSRSHEARNRTDGAAPQISGGLRREFVRRIG
ncbi:hypothetical protein GCM10009634_86180 [Saccharothrix xinjiangensis]